MAADALGLTPLVFLAAALFFVLTMMTYVEGNSLHPERGGASVFARYAFNELWSFVAGWAILLDYLIVMAIGGVRARRTTWPSFWGGADDGLPQIADRGRGDRLRGVVNFRGLSAERFRYVLRLSLANLVLFGVIVVLGLAQLLDPSLITDAGPAPAWEDLVFAAVIATVACTGIEAASGLAGEMRVGRAGAAQGRGRPRPWACWSCSWASRFVALMAVPVQGGTTALGRDVRGRAGAGGGGRAATRTGWPRRLRYAVGGVGALVLLQAVNGQMLGHRRGWRTRWARTARSRACSAACTTARSTPYVTICARRGDRVRRSALTTDLEFLAGIFAFGAMLAFTIAHLSVIVLRFREPERAAAVPGPPSVSIGSAARSRSRRALGALLAAARAGSRVVACTRARASSAAAWMVFGLALYVIYRRVPGQAADASASRSRPRRSRRRARVEYGSILVPVFGGPLDDDIVGTAGRLAAEEAARRARAAR